MPRLTPVNSLFPNRSAGMPKAVIGIFSIEYFSGWHLLLSPIAFVLLEILSEPLSKTFNSVLALP